MDVLTGLLDGPRARGAFLLRSELDPPFSIRIEDEAPLTIAAVLRGEAWLLPDDGPAEVLRPGGVALLRGPDHYTVADEPGRAASVIIQPGQVSTTVDGEELCAAMDLGVRTWGDRVGGEVLMLTGTYQSPSAISRLLLGALPPVVLLAEDDWQCPFLDLLSAEMSREQSGQEVVLDRLLDLVVIEALRAWSTRPGPEVPAAFRADADPVVGAALALLQQDPAREWTVAALAAEVRISRAALARRFTELVGVPPMTYLTQWRLAQAADLLRDSTDTIGAVARKVGYGSAFALSTAFKRSRGVSPHHYRLETRSA